MSGNWDPKECSLKIGAIEVLGLNKFEVDTGDKKTHIETSQGIGGINRTYKKPTGSLEVVLTNEALATLYGYYEDNDEVVIVYTAPGYSLTITGAELDRPKPSGDIAKAPTVAITFLGLTCTEAYGGE